MNLDVRLDELELIELYEIRAVGAAQQLRMIISGLPIDVFSEIQVGAAPNLNSGRGGRPGLPTTNDSGAAWPRFLIERTLPPCPPPPTPVDDDATPPYPCGDITEVPGANLAVTRVHPTRTRRSNRPAERRIRRRQDHPTDSPSRRQPNRRRRSRTPCSRCSSPIARNSRSTTPTTSTCSSTKTAPTSLGNCSTDVATGGSAAPWRCVPACCDNYDPLAAAPQCAAPAADPRAVGRSSSETHPSEMTTHDSPAPAEKRSRSPACSPTPGTTSSN